MEGIVSATGKSLEANINLQMLLLGTLIHQMTVLRREIAVISRLSLADCNQDALAYTSLAFADRFCLEFSAKCPSILPQLNEMRSEK